jgi:hypothetical protein
MGERDSAYGCLNARTLLSLEAEVDRSFGAGRLAMRREPVA